MKFDALKGLQMWIVEDDEDLRAVWRQAMEIYGINCKTFPRGEDVIAAFETERRPDLFMCDFYLPGMNGEEIIKEAFLKYGVSPALLVTGKQETQSTLTKMPKDLRFKILKKPVAIKVVLESLVSLLSD